MAAVQIFTHQHHNLPSNISLPICQYRFSGIILLIEHFGMVRMSSLVCCLFLYATQGLLINKSKGNTLKILYNKSPFYFFVSFLVSKSKTVSALLCKSLLLNKEHDKKRLNTKYHKNFCQRKFQRVQLGHTIEKNKVE